MLDLNLDKVSLSLALLVVIALAVRQDLGARRISNALTLTALVVGLALQTLLSGTPGLISALAGAGVGLACFLPLYLGGAWALATSS